MGTFSDFTLAKIKPPNKIPHCMKPLKKSTIEDSKLKKTTLFMPIDFLRPLKPLLVLFKTIQMLTYDHPILLKHNELHESQPQRIWVVGKTEQW